MIKKLNSQKGSAMQVAIIAILLVGICGTAITSMVINQTKFNIKNSQSTDLKYETETGVEEVIAEFIEKIKVEGENSTTSDFDILQLYVQLADILVASNGIVNTTINNILEKMADGTVNQTDMYTLVNQLDEVLGTAGGSNSDAKELIAIAQDYAKFFADNFFNEDTKELDLSNVTYEKCKELILKITHNLSEKQFESGNGNNTTTYYGNVGVVYRDVTLSNNKYSGDLDGIHDIFLDRKNVTNKINELNSITGEDEIKSWSTKYAEGIINNINATNHKSNIDAEEIRIDKGGYLDEKELKHLYDKTGNISENMRELVKKRLNIVEQEIDMLLQWLAYIKDKENGSVPGGGETTGHLIVSVPKSINIGDYNSKIKKSKVTHYTIDDETAKLLVDDSNKYRFEIIKSGVNTKVVVNLKVESEVKDDIKGDYKIESNVEVKVHNIVNKKDYKIDYEVQDWKKVN